MAGVERGGREKATAGEVDRSATAERLFNEIIQPQQHAASLESVPVLDISGHPDSKSLKQLPPEDSTRQVYDKVSPAVVRIFTPINQQYLAVGTGFFIDTKGRIATAEHVIDANFKPGDITITTSNGVDHKAVLEKVDLVHDLAVLKIDKTPAGIKPLTLSDGTSLRQGDSLYTLGHPDGVTQTFISPGSLSRTENRLNATVYGQFFISRNDWSGFPHTGYIVANSHTEPGDSGGPTVDFSGKVVGVLVSNNAIDGPNSDLSVSSGQLEKLLRSSNPAFLPAAASWPDQLAGSYIDSWKSAPLMTAVETGIIGYLASAMPKLNPAVIPSEAALLGTVNAVSDLSVLMTESHRERMNTHWLALASDVAMAAGGLLAVGCLQFRRPTALSMGLIGVGTLGRLAACAIPKFKTAVQRN